MNLRFCKTKFSYRLDSPIPIVTTSSTCHEKLHQQLCLFSLLSWRDNKRNLQEDQAIIRLSPGRPVEATESPAGLEAKGPNKRTEFRDGAYFNLEDSLLVLI